MDKEVDEKLNNAISAARTETVRYTFLLWLPILISSIYDLLELSTKNELLIFVGATAFILLFVSKLSALFFLVYVALVYYNFTVLADLILIGLIPLAVIIAVQNKLFKRIDNLAYNTDFEIEQFGKPVTHTWSVSSLIAPFFTLALAFSIVEILTFALDIEMYFFNVMNSIPYLVMFSILNVGFSYRLKFKTAIAKGTDDSPQKVLRETER